MHFLQTSPPIDWLFLFFVVRFQMRDRDRLKSNKDSIVDLTIDRIQWKFIEPIESCSYFHVFFTSYLFYRPSIRSIIRLLNTGDICVKNRRCSIHRLCRRTSVIRWPFIDTGSTGFPRSTTIVHRLVSSQFISRCTTWSFGTWSNRSSRSCLEVRIPVRWSLSTRSVSTWWCDELQREKSFSSSDTLFFSFLRRSERSCGNVVR